MTKNTNTAANTAKANTANAAAIAESNMAETVAAVIPATSSNVTPIGRGTKANKSHFVSKYAVNIGEQAASKSALITSVKQRLAEAFDLYQAGGAKAREGEEIAQKQSNALYTGYSAGILSRDEMNATLIDVFGPKVSKATGKPSKTPDGAGEAIRKRVIRAYDAFRYVENDERTPFYEGLDKAKVSQVLHEVGEGLSLWSAYDKLAELRKEHKAESGTVPLVLDGKKMAGVAEALTSDENVEAIRANPALATIYAAILETLMDVLDAEPAAKAA